MAMLNYQKVIITMQGWKQQISQKQSAQGWTLTMIQAW